MPQFDPAARELVRGRIQNRPTIGLSDIGPLARVHDGRGRDLANSKPGILGSSRRGAGRVDRARWCSGVAASGALGRRPWPPPWPGGACPGCREGRDFARCSPSARERMFRRESPSGLGPLHRRFIGCDVASAHRGRPKGVSRGPRMHQISGSILIRRLGSGWPLRIS